MMTTKISTHNNEVSLVAHTKETNIGMNMSIKSKPSTDTADIIPFNLDLESESNHNNDYNNVDDDDDDVCHICFIKEKYNKKKTMTKQHVISKN